MLEKCCSSLPRSRRMLEKCRSSLLRSHRWLEMAARACPGAAAGSKWPLKPAPEPQNARKVLLKPGPQPQNAREVLFEPAPQPQNARKVPLELAPEPQNARKVPLEPAPEPQHALEKYCILFVCYRHQLLLSSTLLRWARSCWGVRIGRSNPLGLAAPSTRQSRTKTNRPGQAKPTQRRFAGRGRGCLLHSEPARPRWGARLGRSSPLGLAGALDRTEPNENEPNQTGLRPSLLGDAPLGRTTDACGTQHRDEHTPCIECTGTH
jgi:hypothetical protein